MMVHLSQLMTGHGLLNRFLNQFDRVPVIGCFYCGLHDCYSEENDKEYHTLVHCEAFKYARDDLIRVIARFRLLDLVTYMLELPAK